MTTLDDLPDLFPAPSSPRPGAPSPRKCWRHSPVMRSQWDEATQTVRPVRVCDRCGRPIDEAIATRNRRNRQRGNRTSRELAAYLGGRNVEALGLPWDVEAKGCRVQSKRLSARPSRNAVRSIVEAIGDLDSSLPAFFLVAPRQRLGSGVVFVDLPAWVGWHGWSLPDPSWVHVGTLLLEMPVESFRDLHIGVAA